MLLHTPSFIWSIIHTSLQSHTFLSNLTLINPSFKLRPTQATPHSIIYMVHTSQSHTFLSNFTPINPHFKLRSAQCYSTLHNLYGRYFTAITHFSQHSYSDKSRLIHTSNSALRNATPHSTIYIMVHPSQSHTFLRYPTPYVLIHTSNSALHNATPHSTIYIIVHPSSLHNHTPFCAILLRTF